jgi:hypothetical protein
MAVPKILPMICSIEVRSTITSGSGSTITSLRSSRFCAKLGGLFIRKVFKNQEVMMLRESICPERGIYSSRK